MDKSQTFKLKSHNLFCIVVEQNKDCFKGNFQK